MSRPMHFEIPADDPSRAMDFYKKVFGWSFESWPGPMEYWMATTGDEKAPGINGGLMRRAHPGQGVVTTIGVENVDATIEKLQANGAKITVPKMAVPTIGWLVYFQDPEGNHWGAMQMDPSAA